MHFIFSSADIASHVSYISIFQNSKKSMEWLRFKCKYYMLKQKANIRATLELWDWFVPAYYSGYIKRKGYGNLNNLCAIFMIIYWLLITEPLAWFAPCSQCKLKKLWRTVNRTKERRLLAMGAANIYLEHKVLEFKSPPLHTSTYLSCLDSTWQRGDHLRPPLHCA